MTLETTEIKQKLVNQYIQRFPGEAAEVFTEISVDEIMNYLKDQPLHVTRDILLRLDSITVSNILSTMDDPFFVDLFPTFDPYTAALIISRLDKDQGEKKLTLLIARMQS